MARASDLIFGRILVKNRLATEESVRECMRLLETATTAGGGRHSSLAELMVERGLIARQAAERAVHAAARLQAERFLKFANEMGLLTLTDGEAALEEYKRLGYRGTFAEMLVRRGTLAPEQCSRVIARDPRTLDEGIGHPAPVPHVAPAPGAQSAAAAPAAPQAAPLADGATARPAPVGAGAPSVRPMPPAPASPPTPRVAAPEPVAIAPVTPAAAPGAPPVPPPPHPPRPVPPPPPPLAMQPSAPAAPGLAQALHGGARDLAAIALRDGLLNRAQLEAALGTAPPGAFEDPAQLAAALVGARVLACCQASQADACARVERDQTEIALEGYYLVAPLGFGPCGPVLRARRQPQVEGGEPGPEVALEVLTPLLAADARRFEAFRKRTGAVSAPECPSLARTLDAGRSGDCYYIARELPEGESLAARLKRGPIPEREAIRLVRSIAEALSALKTVGLSHGAIRPENIVIAPDGSFVLRDAGAVPYADEFDPDQPPPCADPPRYLAPEAIAGEPFDLRSDLYSLGVTVFEAVTGRPPFDGETSADIIAQHFARELPDPGEWGAKVSPRFQGMLKVLTRKSAAERYASLDDLLEDLAGVEQGTMALETDEGSDRTILYGSKPAAAGDGHDRTLLVSQEEDQDLKEMRRAAAERRAKEAAARAGLPVPGAVPGPLTPPAPGQDPLVGCVLSGRYRLVRKLGAGGMGSVYLAEHLLLHKNVALKILHPKLLANEEAVRRFDREVKAASRFSHPGITQIFDAGEDVGQSGKLHYMVMEYVEGTDLEQIIRKEGALALSRVLALFRQVLAAVGEAHKKGIVHRDMKADNIMICRGRDGSEVAKIMDFGIAKIVEGAEGYTATGLHNQQSFKTRKGVVTGTPQYMSPEQAAGDPNIDARSDIYSLGVILYEMCLGELPFKSNTAMGYLGKHIVEPPIPPKVARPDLDLPADLVRIILKALEKPREARYQTAGEMLADLETTVLPYVSGGRAPERPGRLLRKILIPLALCAIVAGLAAGVWFGWRWWNTRREMSRADSLREAEQALQAGDFARARAALEPLGLGEDAAVAALRRRITEAEQEAVRTQQWRRCLREGDEALRLEKFDEAEAAYKEARKIRDDAELRAAFGRLADRRHEAQARALEQEADSLLNRDEPDAALEKLEAALRTKPSNRLAAKVQAARFAADLRRAASLVATGREKEAADLVRAALRLLPPGDERAAGAQRKLAEALMAHRARLTPEQARAYMEELLGEARARDEADDFRGALQYYADARLFADGDELEARERDFKAAEIRAADQNKFELAMDLARKVRSDPTADEASRREVIEALERYLRGYDGEDGRPKGHFLDQARAELEKWKE